MSFTKSLRQALKTSRQRTVMVSMLALIGVAVWVVMWQERSEIFSFSGQPSPMLVDQTDLSESFATVQNVIAIGGAPLAREAAIAWLDRQARERHPLNAEAEKLLLNTLRNDGHPEWSDGYRQHLFNSACNALRVQPSDGGEALARILQSQAASHSDRVLRLYALQHLDSMRNSGQIPGPLGEKIHHDLQALATTPDSDVAGAALFTLHQWDGPASDESSASVVLAGEVAADRSRPVDVRVSAIHLAGSAALDPARTIAADISEPILLRKAAIARIGRHGDRTDLPILQSLRAESARLGQAAEPALKALQARLDDSGTPVPKLYQTFSTRSSP